MLTISITTALASSPATLSWTSDISHNTFATSDDFDVFTASYDQSDGPNAPVYWNQTKNSKTTLGIKLYATKNSTKGNKVTISTSTEGIYITKVEVTGSTAQGTCALYWDGTATTTGESKTYTEASKTTSVYFALKETGNSKNGQYIITSITVTYSGGSSALAYRVSDAIGCSPVRCRSI